MKKHFVTFYSPGTFVSETTTKPIDSWDAEEAKEMARGISERHGAKPYGFRFSTRERGENDLDSSETKCSGMYFLGGTVKTIDEVEQGSILHRNMKCNGWDRVIENNNSWRFTAPLEKDDVVLEWAA